MATKTIYEDCDILVVGGGMGGTGAAYEARYWGRDMKIIVAEKANIDRSGAVAQGLYAINCYMGTQWGENNPEETWPLIWPVTLIPPYTSSRNGACRS